MPASLAFILQAGILVVPICWLMWKCDKSERS